MPPTAELSPTIEPLQRDAVLREAQALRGESLARDAWRRLRRNRLAMACLVFLIVISALALLTPLLPLQSPYMVDTPRSFEPPTARPLFVETIKLDQPAADASAPASQADWINKQFGSLNPVNRWLVQMRVKLFGAWSLNSLCGRDELGRDLLARVFWAREFP